MNPKMLERNTASAAAAASAATAAAVFIALILASSMINIVEAGHEKEVVDLLKNELNIIVDGRKQLKYISGGSNNNNEYTDYTYRFEPRNRKVKCPNGLVNHRGKNVFELSWIEDVWSSTNEKVLDAAFVDDAKTDSTDYRPYCDRKKNNVCCFIASGVR